MNNASISKLRVDRRLHRRRGWIAEDELQRELDALPDVADKIRQLDEDSADTGSAPREAAASGPGSPAAPEGAGA
jgi:hypothetical protein